ncbi:MAG: alpha/beta hydrolase [Pseudomonadota bacterium]
MKRILVLALVLVLAAAGGAISLYQMASSLAAPSQRMVGAPPEDLPVEAIVVSRDGAAPLHGWYIEGHPSLGGVLLMHGIRADRRQMMDRARFLNAAGYSVLSIDFQAHGETQGDSVTFGYLESFDARDAMAYLRSRVGDRPVGVIGFSLGGAAALLGPQPLQADAVVLEAVFSTLERAVQNRMVRSFGGFGNIVSALLLIQVPPRVGIPLDDLAPILAIPRLHVPVMIVAGTDDVHTLASESRALYAEANEPKVLWMIEGARHQDFYAYTPIEYRARILSFFEGYLR